MGGTAASASGSGTVLDHVSIAVEPGTMTAVVGPSGAGKSTLANLVPRLYDVTSGAVLVDGHDVRSLTQDSLRAAIGVVTQDPHLFHDTVLANLRYARPEASEADVREACRAARIDHVIAALPEGYDTVVGERGYRLSGGEKQRLAIARVLLKDPAVVILDEATSHLDAGNEHHVQAALDRALEGRTSIVIAHRLSTVRGADQIVVIDEGRVVERGTHLELLSSGGLYAELYDTLLHGARRRSGGGGDAVGWRRGRPGSARPVLPHPRGPAAPVPGHHGQRAAGVARHRHQGHGRPRRRPGAHPDRDRRDQVGLLSASSSTSAGSRPDRRPRFRPAHCHRPDPTVGRSCEGLDPAPLSHLRARLPP